MDLIIYFKNKIKTEDNKGILILLKRKLILLNNTFLFTFITFKGKKIVNNI